MSVPAPIEEAPAVEVLDPAGEAGIVARSPQQLFWRRFRQDRFALVSLGFVVFLVFVALFAPLITSILGLPNPNTQNPQALDSFGSPSGPSSEHLLGVDQLGRDVLSRTIYGARVSLEVAFLSTGVAVIIGVTIGMMAAFYGTPSAVKLLLEAGADPLLKNEQALTAIDFAHRNQRQESADIIAAFVRAKQPKGKW